MNQDEKISYLAVAAGIVDYKFEEENLDPSQELLELKIPASKAVNKIRLMLQQLETWANQGDTELTRKHWKIIAVECLKNADSTREVVNDNINSAC